MWGVYASNTRCVCLGVTHARMQAKSKQFFKSKRLWHKDPNCFRPCTIFDSNCRFRLDALTVVVSELHRTGYDKKELISLRRPSKKYDCDKLHRQHNSYDTI
eukprot:6041780-Amphidinium_carterae.1